MTNTKLTPETAKKTERTESSGAPLRVEIDWDYYIAMLDEQALSYDEKREYVQTWWNIVVSFVHLGFHVDSVHTVLDELKISEKTTSPPPSSRSPLSNDFRQTKPVGGNKLKTGKVALR